MSTKHTPLRLETSPDGTVVKIVEANNQTIAAIDWGFDIAGAANMARLIVTAVNSRDDLVEALEGIQNMIWNMSKLGYSDGQILADVNGVVMAALSKAKGE